jgi:hypothetical protein
MNDITLDLDDTDFEQLLTLARSSIPALAPGWTDHNVHDPGIMLMELLAWVADSQVYALSRVRHDERLAYARLLGLRPEGPRPAQGLIWPIVDGVLRDFSGSKVLAADTSVDAKDYREAPGFYLSHPIALSSARLISLTARYGDGSRPRDYTRANLQYGVSFVPFGSPSGAGDRLVLQLRGPLLDPAAVSGSHKGFLSIGVAVVGAGEPAAEGGSVYSAQLRIALEDSLGERPVQLVADTTAGLLHSGVLLLRIDERSRPRDETFRLTVASGTGSFVVSPRLLCIALNVLPIRQLQRVQDEVPRFGQGLPDQRWTLSYPGLYCAAQAPAVEVSIANEVWRECVSASELTGAGPDDRVFVLDRTTGTLAFGNGVNGRRVPAGAPLRASYRITSGARGNLPPDLVWQVAGVAAAFGTNLAATTAGDDGVDANALRTLAREKVRALRPIVTKSDLESAALTLSELDVRRAIEITDSGSRRVVTGTRSLVVVGSSDPSEPVESSARLRAIASRLAPRLPLGQRLVVRMPRYVELRIRAELVAAPNQDPQLVAANLRTLLETRLATLPQGAESSAWRLGRNLTSTQLKAWLRSAPGIARVVSVELSANGETARDGIVRFGVNGLPKLVLESSDLKVARFSKGGAT